MQQFIYVEYLSLEDYLYNIKAMIGFRCAMVEYLIILAPSNDEMTPRRGEQFWGLHKPTCAEKYGISIPEELLFQGISFPFPDFPGTGEWEFPSN